MKKLIKLFILVQLLDLFTTVFGIVVLSIKEANQLMLQFSFIEMVVLKLFMIFSISFIMYKFNLPRWSVWLLILLSSIAPIYNFIIILLSI